MVVQRAELDQDDKPKWIGLMITMIIAGSLVFGAQDIIEWFGDEDIGEEDSLGLPENVKDMVDRGLGFLI